MTTTVRRRVNDVNRVESFSDLDLDVLDEGSTTVEKKDPITLKKVLTRTVTAFILIGLYMGMLRAGHFYCILVTVLIQCELYRELVNIRYVAAKENEIPWFRTLQWAWFFVPMISNYGETVHKFCSDHQQFAYLTVFTDYLRDAVFAMYCILFMASVLTLKQNLLRFQLGQYMWSIITVCMVVFQIKFFALNTLNGLFWFWFPMATVVMNDVSAYFCGITMGRKFIQSPFFKISPNKTWEGFIGAGFLTLIFSFFFPVLLSKYTYLICPAEGLYITSLPPALNCTPHNVFQLKSYDVPLLGHLSLYPIQLHGLAYGLFASIVAPFGGFFASAIKRAYNKKDFQSFLPGSFSCTFLYTK